MTEEWDVEQHKSEHESDEHWELRRKFLLTHKDKFPEDELLSLAQAFINVEFLGCRYPKETMYLIAELAHDIAKDFREKQKIRLQRTFVTASDAATSKVKGHTSNKSKSEEVSYKDIVPEHISKKFKSEEVPYKDIGPGHTSKKSKSKEHLPYGDVVLVERPGDLPQTIIASAINASGGTVQWKYSRIHDMCHCGIFINLKSLAEASGKNQKAAKKEASALGLKELQRYYYTIKIKQNINEKTNVSTSTMFQNIPVQETISDDNIGKKLMKLMGWRGGGLGKSQQGIVEPVVVKQQVSRQGLGLKPRSFTSNDLKNKCRNIMKKYQMGDMDTDLVFSAEFATDERAMIHQLTRQMGLKSHSYGPKNKRRLVISRKIDTRDLVTELKNLGGSTNKYELLKPTDLQE